MVSYPSMKQACSESRERVNIAANPYDINEVNFGQIVMGVEFTHHMDISVNFCRVPACGTSVH